MLEALTKLIFDSEIKQAWDEIVASSKWMIILVVEIAYM